MSRQHPRKLGNIIAPPRFIAFALVMALATPLVALAMPDAARWFDWRHALLIGFDLAALGFLLSTISLLRAGDSASLRAHAADNDANRTILLLLTGLLIAVLCATIASLFEGGAAGWMHNAIMALVIVTLALAWLFANTVFAFHYAHLHYRPDAPRDGHGLEFPRREQPDFWDFLYFSFTLGMTFQTSDVTIAGRLMRRVVLLHCLISFAFNIGILAFVINTLGN